MQDLVDISNLLLGTPSLTHTYRKTMSILPRKVIKSRRIITIFQDAPGNLDPLVFFVSFGFNRIHWEYPLVN